MANETDEIVLLKVKSTCIAGFELIAVALLSVAYKLSGPMTFVLGGLSWIALFWSLRLVYDTTDQRTCRAFKNLTYVAILISAAYLIRLDLQFQLFDWIAWVLLVASSFYTTVAVLINRKGLSEWHFVAALIPVLVIRF